MYAVETTGQCYEVKDSCPIAKKEMILRNTEEEIGEQVQERRRPATVYKWECSSICSICQE